MIDLVILPFLIRIGSSRRKQVNADLYFLRIRARTANSKLRLAVKPIKRINVV